MSQQEVPFEYLSDAEKEASTVLIGIPHTGEATYHHFLSLVNCQIPFTRHYSCKSGYALDITRNLIVTDALKLHAGWLFFVDSDIRLRPETFHTLYDSHLPIISGAYLTRSPPYNICARINTDYLSRDLLKQPGKFYQVHDVGMGCCLIDRRVFLRIAQRLNEWFCLADHTKDVGKFTLKYSNAEAIKSNYECPKCQNTLVAFFFQNVGKDHTRAGQGEDFYFCKLARETGFDIYFANNAVVGHEPSKGDWEINENGAQTTVVNAGLV